MKRCAFLTLADAGTFQIDDDHAIAPLAALGWQVETVPWTSTETPWARFDAVVLRSTWDWFEDPLAFERTLTRIDAVTRLANPLPVLRWNLSKRYLNDLEAGGVRIVPTHFFERWDPAALRRASSAFGSDDLVIKPVIGANGVDTFRISATAATPDIEAGITPGIKPGIATAFAARAGMIQPFRRAVLDEGEFSTFWFGGAFSHAILKRPAQGEFRSQEERGAQLQRVDPTLALLEAGRCALSVAEGVGEGPLLYARADFLRDADGHFELMELELLEPSLYLRLDAQAPARFARALDDWFAPR